MKNEKEWNLWSRVREVRLDLPSCILSLLMRPSTFRALPCQATLSLHSTILNFTIFLARSFFAYTFLIAIPTQFERLDGLAILCLPCSSITCSSDNDKFSPMINLQPTCGHDHFNLLHEQALRFSAIQHNFRWPCFWSLEIKAHQTDTGFDAPEWRRCH